MLDFLSAISVGSGPAEAGAADADDGREVGEQVEAVPDGLPGRFPVQFPADLAQRPVGLHQDGAGAVVGRGGGVYRSAKLRAGLHRADRRRLAPHRGGQPGPDLRMLPAQPLDLGRRRNRQAGPAVGCIVLRRPVRTGFARMLSLLC